METTIATQSEKLSLSLTQAVANTPIKKGQLGDPNFEVQQFMKNYARAVRGGNLDEILSFFSDNIEAFECPPLLAFHGIREHSQNWKAPFSSEFRFPVTYEFVGEKIFVDGKIATFTSLLHVCGTSRKSDQEIETWLRMTCVLDKSEGYWQIVHDHMSIPVSEEGFALMNLSPDQILNH